MSDTTQRIRKPLTPEQRKQAQDYLAKWEKTHVRRVNYKFNLNTDADILARLDSVPNKLNYIKSLIRADIAAHKKEEE